MTKRYSSEELNKMRHLSKTDWNAVDALPMTNEIDDEFDISQAEIIYPKSKAKKQIAFRIEEDLLEFLKAQADIQNMRGYQSLMHAILESYRSQKTR